MKILAATFNAHKIQELKALFPAHEILSPSELGIAQLDIDEDGDSYFANAMIKAKALWGIARIPTLADDSGLSVKALGGAPGIHSARYGSNGGGQGLSQKEKNERLLGEMRGVENRECAFFCCLVLVTGDDSFVSVQETCPGLLAEKAQGEGGFGYDPLVYLPELEATVAQLPPELKNRVSHRGKAARLLDGILSNILGG